MDAQRLIQCARGDRQADLLLKDGQMVDVLSGRIENVDIAVIDGRIAGFGDYAADTVVNLSGSFVAPGFIDAHLHIESAMASVTEFARAVVPLGVTTVVADPHEIANVLGVEGIRYMLAAAENQPLGVYYTLPSCVPATAMETAGAALGVRELSRFMGEERIRALAEMMNFPGVVAGDPAVLGKIALARQQGKRVDGHAPGLTGKPLAAYVAAGIESDHECTTAAEAREKLAMGMHIMIREGTGARNLDALFPVINEKTMDRMMWCTDDRHPHDILAEGHVDHIIRSAVALGLDPVSAIRMGTLHPARYFGLHDVGALTPGRRADMVIFPDLRAPRAEAVYVGGRLTAEKGNMRPEIPPPLSAGLPPSMHIAPDTVDFALPAQGRRIRVIDVIPDQLVTGQSVLDATIRDGMAVADPSRDILKIAVVERYTGKGGTGLGFVRGFGLRRGALASSVAHDSHNIIVVGTDDKAMKTALEAVVRMGGGLCAAFERDVRAALPLPIAGLMSPEPMTVIRDRLDDLIAAAAAMGGTLRDPFMTLSFLALPVIPELKLTDMGLVDVGRFEVVPLFVE
ncbi:adenine deaminase [Desulfococcus sp.]|uniref:adenine deaminase n=1 Tax=Desulfococcus sp. TaxID=2025834 RepID=UPI003D0B8536